MFWLDLFSQFDMTICRVPGKSSVVANARSYFPDFAAVVGPIESSLLTWDS